MKIQMTSAKADIILLVLAIVWGSGFSVTKAAIAITSPTQFLTYRFVISAILSLVFFNRRIRRAGKKDWFAGILMGVFLAVSMQLQTVGLQYTSAGKAVFIASAFVLMVPFFYWILTKEKPKLKIVVAAVMMMFGLALMSLDPAGIGGLNKGDLFVLASTISFAMHTTVIGIYAPKGDPFLLSGIQFLTSGVLFLAASVFDTARQPVTAEAVWAVLYSAVIITFLCFFVQVYCQKFTSPSRAAILINLESIFGTMIAILFLGESYDMRMIFSFAVIFTAALIAELNWKD